MCDGEIVLIEQLELVLEHLGASFVKHVLNAVELVDQVGLLAFGQLLQPYVLDLNAVCLLESFWVSHQCLPDYFGAFQLFAQCAVVVLEAVVSQSLLDQDLLTGTSQKLQLYWVKVACWFHVHIAWTFAEQFGQLLTLFLSLGVVFFERILQSRYLLPHLKQFPLTYINPNLL